MKRKFLFTSILALLVITFTTALVTQSTHLLIKKSPLAEAAAEIKVNGTLAYLWFDEIMSGDTAQSIQEVWYYLEIADWHIVALLEGGESIMGNYQPVDDPELRKKGWSRFVKRSLNFGCAQKTPISTCNQTAATLLIRFAEMSSFLSLQVKPMIFKDLSKQAMSQVSTVIHAPALLSFWR
ncbi:hypothetical protein QW180_17910 [Vibrio sinaloensis]|nr:hypothetical protein [Vibrio sinaloensis]